MADSLDRWLLARAAMSARIGATPSCAPVHGIRDGHEHFIQTFVAPRNENKAIHWRAALARCRFDASLGGQLTWQRLSAWNAMVLGSSSGAHASDLRRTVAYAKGGREQYGILCDFSERLRLALAESDDHRLPVTTRAARVYLDVAFFHPFADGNARSAALAFDFVLAREGIFLDQLAPVFLVPRSADDHLAGTQLADLVEVLLVTTRMRSTGKSFDSPVFPDQRFSSKRWSK